jgi:hypothetical protein
MMDAQGQGEFSENGWQAALEQAELHLMNLLDAQAALEDEIEAQLAVVALLEELASPPE